MSTETPQEPSIVEPAPETAPDPAPTPAAEKAAEPTPEATVDAPAEETKAEAPAEAPAEAASEPAPVEAAPEPAPAEATVDAPAEEAAEPTPSEATVDTPAEEAPGPVPAPKPTPAAPSPAVLAAKMAAARPASPVTSDHSASARFGRVDPDGTVYVVSGEEEHAVGSYPGAGADEALQYFARKYDELYGMAELLEQRLAGASELTAKDASDQLSHLSEQVTEPAFVGDLASLRSKLEAIERAVAAKRDQESATRAAAKAAAAVERESLVQRAEKIAAQDPSKVQWKRSGEELRTLFDQWKAHQRGGVKLDKPVEAELWHRFSAARSHFDKARRAHFAELETTQSEAKLVKERLVKEAEHLSTSKDWGPTAREFKQLMDRWRAAGRAGRTDDDALWERFKAAQDTFFTAKDEVVAAEEEEFRHNLGVKQELLAEADALLPITDLESTKAALRSIQERWDKAGKVPRADMERTEKAMRRVEQAVREAEDKKWSSSNPEARARAQSLVDQLEKAVAGLEQDLAKAQATGNEKKLADARTALEARQGWLDQARAGLDEFS